MLCVSYIKYDCTILDLVLQSSDFWTSTKSRVYCNVSNNLSLTVHYIHDVKHVVIKETRKLITNTDIYLHIHIHT
jgi:hypothetical protein